MFFSRYLNRGFFARGYFGAATDIAPPERAFDKTCAPDNPAIGPYRFVDDCRFPTAPDPVFMPINVDVPLPPIDVGCYPLSISGSYKGPHSERSPAGISTSVRYINDDPCTPLIDVDLTLPCLTGGEHSATNVLPDYIPERYHIALVTWKNGKYVTEYGDSAASQPYYNKAPTGLVYINTDLPLIASASSDTKRPFGAVARAEFNSSCDLQMDLSLYVPCGPQSPKFEFYDYEDRDNPSPEPLDGYTYSIKPNPTPPSQGCYFDDTAQLFLTPGGGGGDAGVLAKLTNATQYPSGIQRWKYDWVKIRLNSDGSIFELEDTGSVDDGKYAINLYEILNFQTLGGVQGNGIDESDPLFPPGFELKPVFQTEGPGIVVRLTTAPEWDLVGSSYSTRMVFSYNNAEDGICA